jgi:hypothetical protein
MVDLFIVYDANVAVSGDPFPQLLVECAAKPTVRKTTPWGMLRTSRGFIFIELVYETMKVYAAGSLGNRSV